MLHSGHILKFPMQVYLLKVGSSAQEHFEKLVNLLEQLILNILMLFLLFLCI